MQRALFDHLNCESICDDRYVEVLWVAVGPHIPKLTDILAVIYL